MTEHVLNIARAVARAGGRALIVGDVTTHGKGSVQNIIELSRFDRNLKSAVKVTIQKWYAPSGSSIQLKGVGADIVVPRGDDIAWQIRKVAPDGVDGLADGAFQSGIAVGADQALRQHAGVFRVVEQQCVHRHMHRPWQLCVGRRAGG